MLLLTIGFCINQTSKNTSFVRVGLGLLDFLLEGLLDLLLEGLLDLLLEGLLDFLELIFI
jgi:hypothetical protein